MAKTDSTFELTTLPNGRLLRREIFAVPRRFLGKCRCCRRPLSALVTEIVCVRDGMYGMTETAAITYTNGYLEFTCGCGAWTYVKRVLGKVSPKHQCNAKCLASTSGKCECSCGGKNHGASYAA